VARSHGGVRHIAVTNNTLTQLRTDDPTCISDLTFKAHRTADVGNKQIDTLVRLQKGNAHRAYWLE
jgi:hypothetical protein